MIISMTPNEAAVLFEKDAQGHVQVIHREGLANNKGRTKVELHRKALRFWKVEMLATRHISHDEYRQEGNTSPLPGFLMGRWWLDLLTYIYPSSVHDGIFDFVIRVYDGKTRNPRHRMCP